MVLQKPWETLANLLEKGQPDDIKAFIDTLNTDELAGSISHIDSAERKKILQILQPEDAADLMEDIPWIHAISMIEDLSSKDAAAIISEMRSDDQADILNELDVPEAEAIIDHLERKDADKVKELIKYDSDSAGGLMITEFLSYDENTTIGEVVKDLSENAEEYENYTLQYIYVTANDEFIGVLQMRDLLLNKSTSQLSNIVIRDALTLKDVDQMDIIKTFFDTYDFYGAPVVNNQSQLVGVILRKQVREMEAEIAHIEHLETQGIVGGEELRTMPVFLRSRRRLSWLSVNILLNIIAASIIAFYQETLTAVIALAVFLPIISDMSGCSGNQAVAVSLRELSIGVVKPFELARVWFQEVSVGLINGLVLGILIGLAAWLWQGNIYLGLVVGAALMINTVVAVSLGGTLPLFLKKMNVDPALASGPILTTITDMFGFFLALSFASNMLGKL